MTGLSKLSVIIMVLFICGCSAPLSCAYRPRPNRQVTIGEKVRTNKAMAVKMDDEPVIMSLEVVL